MKIVILDGGSTNPGDVCWSPIKALGETILYAETPKELVLKRAVEADIIVSNRIWYDKNTIDNLPNLKCIATLSTGFNNIDIDYAAKKGIAVYNVPEYCVKTVAQMTIALLLSLCNNCRLHSDTVKNIGWNESIKLGQIEAPMIELAGKTMGIVGYGAIGECVANIATAMGMNVIAYSKSPKKIETFSLEEVFAKSDVISLHCALNKETKGIVSERLFKVMKKGALIINTARAGIIEEKDLIEALEQKIIGAIATDVMWEEPPPVNHPLFQFKNCIITPHIAWSSREARQRLIDKVAININSYILGNNDNKVN